MKKLLILAGFLLLGSLSFGQNVNDPCSQGTKQLKAINTTANAVLVSGVAGKKVYVCSLGLVVGAATNVAIVEGTGSTCGTNTAGINGGTTAATGWNFAANGGIALGHGTGYVMHTVTAGDDLCILVSAANQTSGPMEFVIF